MKARVTKLDRLFTAYAILNDARCVTCGAINPTLQGGHLFGRTRQSVKWDFRNCYCQCASCNGKHENNFMPLYRIAIKRHGQEELDKLEVQSNTPYTDVDHEWIREEMLKVIRELPRWKKLTADMKLKIVRSDFTNKALIANLHGYSMGT